MKKNIWLSIFIVVCIIDVDLYAFLSGKERLVVIETTPVYSESLGSNQVNTVPVGAVVSVQKKKGVRLQITFNNQNVWIEQSKVKPLEFSSKNFSDNSALFIPASVSKDGVFWFVYNKMMYKMNLSDLTKLSAESQASLPRVLDAEPSIDYSLWLLSGESTNKKSKVLNLALFYPSLKKFVPLTSFFGDDVIVKSLEFSDNNQYVAVMVSIKDRSGLYVFDTSSHLLTFYQSGIQGFQWHNSNLVVFTPLSIDINTPNNIHSWKKKTLYTFKTKQTEAPVIYKSGSEILLSLEDKVFVLNNQTLKETGYDSLERSPNGVIEYYQKQSNIYTLYKKKQIPSLSGKKPMWSFLSILDDTHLLYRIQKEALAEIYLYNAETKTSTPFYWIEEPAFVLSDYTAVEFAVENEEVWMFIERPGGIMVDIFKIHEI
ncbi:MAG: hypothetical protein ACRCTQ_00610 [Brevinemataceae bacterium]